MEISCETEILFSALQLAETLSSDGLLFSTPEVLAENDSQDQTTPFKKQGMHKDKIKIPERSLGPTPEAVSSYTEILHILKDSISEIVNGVEFENIKFEQDHWKFSVVTILCTLALREDIDADTSETEEFVESLQCFPALSLNLVFDLVKECGLELAFVEYLQNLDPEVSLHLLSSATNYLQDVATSDRENSHKWHTFLFNVVSYLLLHKNGLLVKPLPEESLGKLCDVVLQLAGVILSFVKVDDERVDSLKQGEGHKYVMPGIVGLLNFATLLHSGSFVSFDIFSVERDTLDMFTWPANRKTHRKPENNCKSHYQQVLSKYHLEAITEIDLMQSIFEDDIDKSIEELTIGVTSDCKSDILKSVVALLKELLLLDQVSAILQRDLNFAKEARNVVHATQVAWNFSCYNRIMLQKIFGHLLQCEVYDNDNAARERLEQHEIMDGPPSLTHCCGLYEIMDDPTLMRLTREHVMSQAQEFDKAVFIIGEKLGGYEEYFSQLLSTANKEPLVMNNVLMDCFVSNVHMMQDFERTCQVMDICVDLQTHHKALQFEDHSHLAKTSRDLFINVFAGLSSSDQCKVLLLFYHTVGNPQEFFGVSKEDIQAGSTALLNKLVGTDQSEPPSEFSCKQFALMALQDPDTLLSEVVHSAVRNANHISILGKCLQVYSPVSRFANPLSDETALCSHIGEILAQAETLTDKEMDNFMKLVVFLIQAKVETGDISEDKAASLTVLCDVDKLLLNHVIPLVFGINKNTPVQLSDICTRSWGTTLRLLTQVLQVFTAENKGQFEKERLWTMSEISMRLLPGICWILDDVNGALESDRDLQWIHTKSALVSCIERINTMIVLNIDSLDVQALKMVLYKVPQETSWLIGCYLYPILKCLFRLDTIAKTDSCGPIPNIVVPACIASVVNVTPEESFAFDTVGAEIEPLMSLLKLVSVSDDICQIVCHRITGTAYVLKDESRLILCLALVFQNALPFEWKRIQSVLLALEKQSCFKFHNKPGNSDEQTVSSNNVTPSLSVDKSMTQCTSSTGDINIAVTVVYEYIAEGVVLAITLEKDAEHDSHLDVVIKGLQSIYTTNGLASVKNTARYTGNMCYMTHLYKVCRIISMISRTHQEQLMTILLELVDVFKQSENNITMDGPKWMKGMLFSALDLLPQEVSDVVWKKLQSVDT